MKKICMVFIVFIFFAYTNNTSSKKFVTFNENESVKMKIAKPISISLLDDYNTKIVEKDYNLFTKEVEVFANKNNSVMTLEALGIPFKTVELSKEESLKVYPSGKAVTIKMNTEGVLVLSIGNVNDTEGNIIKPCQGKLKVGDIIYKVNGIDVESKEELSELIENSVGDLVLTVKQGEKINDVTISPVQSIDDKKNKIGIWVRDSTQGIGTVTFISEDKKEFYALGHGIMDIDTRELMTVKEGEANFTEITSVQKGKKGVPGELIGEIKIGNNFGSIESNEQNGVHGLVSDNYVNNINMELMEVAQKEDVKVGPAKILSNIDSDDVKEYDVFIDKVNMRDDSSKSITLTITDKYLLEKTGGIVQGMSGSPIIQNEKIVGAVTHVFVQEPKKGYGIFLEDMLKYNV